MDGGQDDSPRKFTEMAWIKWLGIEPIEARAGLAVIRLVPKMEHLNHNGTINAAILFGLAEVAGAGSVVAGDLEIAARSHTVVRRATIIYVAPARGRVEATGTVDPEVVSEAMERLTNGTPIEVTSHVIVADQSERVTTEVDLTVSVRPRKA